MTTAARPDFYFNSMPSLSDQKANKSGASEEEKQLYSMAHTAGWKVMKTFFERVIDDLDQVNAAAIAGGASFDVIGQNTVINVQTKSILKRALQKVEDAIKACENAEAKAVK